MGIYEKLAKIQQELKAPKGQYNNFGKYKYRSCEDILEAVKPLLAKHGCVLTITDDVMMIGERFYIKAIAMIVDNTGGGHVNNVAYAREPESKTGMDASQITGTASSYARKYALNGLFLIDDTKDADSEAYARQTAQEQPKERQDYPHDETPVKMATPKQIGLIKKIADEKGLKIKQETLDNLTLKQASDYIDDYYKNKKE